MNNKPRVGIGVLIIRNKQLLLGKRMNAHGQGTWSPPGGHLEFGESFQECAIRETLEETGLCINNVQFQAITNDIFSTENKHYVTIFMRGECDQQAIPQLLEPEKCEEWQWFNIDALPEPLFLPLSNVLKIKTLS